MPNSENIKLHTGAFGNALPPYWAARKLHDVYVEYKSANQHDGEIEPDQLPRPATFVYHDPTACSLPSIDPQKLLNLMWQVKSYEMKVDWELKTPTGFGNESNFGEPVPQVTYLNGKSGTYTLDEIALVSSDNFFSDDPMGVAVGNIYKTTIEYNPDPDIARQQIRDEIDYNFYYASIGPKRIFCSGESYTIQREQVFTNFEQYFAEWENRVVETINAFESVTTERGQKWYNDSIRQLNQIPVIKEMLLQYSLLPVIGDMDTFFEEYKDKDWELSRKALRLDYFLKDLIAREEDLELFDLYGGFEYNLDFFSWSNIRRHGAECHSARHPFSADTIDPIQFPCGFFHDESQSVNPNKHLLLAKTKGTVILKPTFYNFAPGWKYTNYVNHTAKRILGEDVGIVNKTSWVEIKFSCSPVDGRTFLGTQYDRAVSTNFFFDGMTYGGDYYTSYLDTEGTQVWVKNTVNTTFDQFFKTNGEAFFPDPPPMSVFPNFSQAIADYKDPECVGGANANEFIYSGPFMMWQGVFYGDFWLPPSPDPETGLPPCDYLTPQEPIDPEVDFSGTIEFFQQALDLAAEYANPIHLDVGMLRFQDQNGSTIYETPIQGNAKIWEKFDVTLTVKDYWYTG